jgi:hypothetical protein
MAMKVKTTMVMVMINFDDGSPFRQQTMQATWFLPPSAG